MTDNTTDVLVYRLPPLPVGYVAIGEIDRETCEPLTAFFQWVAPSQLARIFSLHYGDLELVIRRRHKEELHQ